MEIEVKVLNIVPEQVRQKLEAAGCQYRGREFQQNSMYDFPDQRLYLQEDGSYIRIRQTLSLDTGARRTLLTLKKTVSRQSCKMADETETEVQDPAQMEQFLLKLGFIRIRVDEKIRESWVLPGLHFELDEWAGLPPYLELEASSEAELQRGLALLDYRLADTTAMNLKEVLAMYQIHSDTLRFSDFGRNIPELKGYNDEK